MSNTVTFPAIGRADFNGVNGAGAVSVPGLDVGDLVTFYAQAPGGWQTPGGIFEDVISVAGEIQQISSNDLSPYTFTILFLRAV